MDKRRPNSGFRSRNRSNRMDSVVRSGIVDIHPSSAISDGRRNCKDPLVVDDFIDPVPVFASEVDVLETFFRALLDEAVGVKP